MGLFVSVEKMRQASSELLVGYRGSLIQACLIFLLRVPERLLTKYFVRCCGSTIQGVGAETLEIGQALLAGRIVLDANCTG
jgi:hypothetical protein